MQELKELMEQVGSDRPVELEQMPDIALYMDQIVGYMSRQLIDFIRGEKLTPAMINNYIKDGLLPRADGKRYNREHIVYLTAICVLKQVLSVRDTKVIMGEALAAHDIADFYESFCTEIDRSLGSVQSAISEEMSRDEMTEAALRLAISAYGQQLVCKRLIDILSQPKEPKEQKKKDEK